MENQVQSLTKLFAFLCTMFRAKYLTSIAYQLRTIVQVKKYYHTIIAKPGQYAENIGGHTIRAMEPFYRFEWIFGYWECRLRKPCKKSTIRPYAVVHIFLWLMHRPRVCTVLSQNCNTIKMRLLKSDFCRIKDVIAIIQRLDTDDRSISKDPQSIVMNTFSLRIWY